jgi:DNA-binding LacI/PurR family transcriptional regulator
MVNAPTVNDRRPSLHDIAETAQVAVSTVSRYLNGQLPLKPDTETRVLQAMEDLGYTRSARPTRTKTTRSGVIGLVVPQIGNTYFGRIADSVVIAAEAQGLAVLIVSTLNHSRKQLEYVELLADKDVAGLVYVGNYASNAALSGLIDAGMPVVVMDEALTGAPPVDTVLVDDYAGAYQAVGHLTAQGHDRIAIVTGPASLNSVHERRRGWADALRRADIDPEAQIALTGQFSEDFGTGALSRLLAAPEPPTAVFAASDTIALGMMTGARNLGIRIPEDLSIVGFDDSPGAGWVSPRLTTVRTPVDKMAASAVAALAERIDNPDRPPQMIITPVVLVVGESAAAPAA